MRARQSLVTAVVAGLLAGALLYPSTYAGASHAPGPPGNPSGGKAIGHHAGGKVIHSAAVARRAPKPVYSDTGYDAVEPTLGMTKSKDVFYAASGARNEVIHSKDGEKWDVRSPQLGGQNIHAITLDPYVYVDEWTNRVYTIDLTVACSLMSYSDDLGKTWTTNPLACGRPVNDHQTLFSGPPVSSPTVGYDNVVYYCWNDVATSSCGKSLNGGLTWTPTGSPVFHAGDGTEGQDLPRDCGGLHGHGVVGEDGTVYLPKEHCTEPWLAISRDEGQTWEHVRVANKVAIWGPDPSVAVDAKGNIYYTFLHKDRLPYIVYSRDGGKTWSEPMMFGRPGLTEAALATMDVGAPGKVAMAYYGTDDVDGKVNKRKYNPAKVAWHGYMTTTDDLFAKEPVFYSASVNNLKDPLARGACGPRRCYEAYDFIDVIVGFDGVAWAAFADSCVAVCVHAEVLGGHSGAVARMVGGPSLR